MIGAAGIPFAAWAMKKWMWPWLKKTTPQMLADWIAPRIAAALKGEGINDEDVKEWFEQVTFATVLLAEKKFPDEGMGQEKFQYVFRLIETWAPWAKPFLDSQGTDLSQWINFHVIKMDRVFENAIKKNWKAPQMLHVPIKYLPKPD